MPTDRIDEPTTVPKDDNRILCAPFVEMKHLPLLLRQQRNPLFDTRESRWKDHWCSVRRQISCNALQRVVLG
jgi:hypothetical protein